MYNAVRTKRTINGDVSIDNLRQWVAGCVSEVRDRFTGTNTVQHRGLILRSVPPLSTCCADAFSLPILLALIDCIRKHHPAHAASCSPETFALFGERCLRETMVFNEILLGFSFCCCTECGKVVE